MSSITKKDISKVRYRWLLLGEAAWNYEKMQGLGYCFSMLPILRKESSAASDVYKRQLLVHIWHWKEILPES